MKPVNVAVVGATGAVGEAMMRSSSRGVPGRYPVSTGLQPISGQVHTISRQASYGARSEHL